MNKPKGYATWFYEGEIKERDTFTCGHCNRVVIVEPFSSASDCGGFCRMCSTLICGACAVKECSPFEEMLERMERRDKFRSLIF